MKDEQEIKKDAPKSPQDQGNSSDQPNGMKELEEKIAELENNWKRALADYRNLQKRTEEEKESLVNFVSGMFFRRIIPVLDNLEMLEKHLADEGLKMIAKDFRQILMEEGISEVDALGKDFDPETMEAIEMVPGKKNSASASDDGSRPHLVVVEVLNKGYMLKDKLLRPARVKVGSDQKEGQ